MGAERHDSGIDGLVQREIDLFPSDAENREVCEAPQSAVGLIRGKIVGLSLLERSALEDPHVMEAMAQAGRYGIDLTPVRNRLDRTPDATVVDVYRNLEEYIRMLRRVLEVGEDVAVLHPDREMLKSAYAFREQNEDCNTVDLLLNLESFGVLLKSRRAGIRGLKKVEPKI